MAMERELFNDTQCNLSSHKAALTTLCKVRIEVFR